VANWSTVKLVGKGAFKSAYVISILGTNGTSQSFVVKAPLQIHAASIEDLVNIDVEIGQIGCLIFFEMRKLLDEKMKGIPDTDFARPISTRLELEFQNDKPIPSSNTSLVHVEQVIDGQWKKFLHQFGRIMVDNDVGLLAACFCHFSYVWSEGKLVVADIQGSSNCFTDVAFHTLDGDSGPADFGLDGMKSCAILHQCNKFCKALKIDDDNFETILSEQTKQTRDNLTQGIPQSAVIQFRKFAEEHSKSAPKTQHGYVPFRSQMVTPGAKTWSEYHEGTVLNTAFFKN